VTEAATKILDRLERVRRTGPGRWIACCPAHKDRSPSLSIRELEGGRVLLHDFGGCETNDVLAAIGLGLSDLFDKPLARHLPPSNSRIPAHDLIDLVSHEADVITILVGEALEARQLPTELAWQRLAQASHRIGRARVHMNGR
jgi:hypothetical protein